MSKVNDADLRMIDYLINYPKASIHMTVDDQKKKKEKKKTRTLDGNPAKRDTGAWKNYIVHVFPSPCLPRSL